LISEAPDGFSNTVPVLFFPSVLSLELLEDLEE
jgi:hypothetical protein